MGLNAVIAKVPIQRFQFFSRGFLGIVSYQQERTNMSDVPVTNIPAEICERRQRGITDKILAHR